MNAVNWFAIPVENLERARVFYSTVMGFEEMPDLITPQGICAVFPHDWEQGVGGHLDPFIDIKPDADAGISIWLNCPDGLDATLARITAAGGQLLEEKTDVGEKGEFGFMATILDSEGNRVGLHELTQK